MTYRPRADNAILVAASDAPDRIRFAADPFVCDGTDDHTTINAAIDASLISGATNRYGGVVLSAGRFSMRGAILIPSRGFSIRGQGFRTELYAAVGSGTFSATGEGSEMALIMLAETAAARNAVEVSISDIFFNCTDGSGISGIWFDQSAGGSTNIGSEATYGTPTCADNGDTYHSFSRLRMRGVKHGIGFVGGAGTNTRGNNVSDVRINGVGSGGVAGYGYYTDAASDCHFNQCHVIIDNVVGSTGFYMGGGNSRLTGCKAAYFDGTGSYGFDIASSRNSLDAIEAQDCDTGIRVTGIDCRITGARVETQVSPCTTAVYVSGDNSHITGLYIHRRGTGTYTNGLYYADTSDDRVCEAFIDPAGFTNPLRVGADISVTLADLGNGKYSIRTLGVGNLVST